MSRSETMARAFIAAAHRMNAEHELSRTDQRQTIVRLLASLRDKTQSASEHAECSKLIEVLA